MEEKDLENLDLEYWADDQPILNLKRWVDEQIANGANTVRLQVQWSNGKIANLKLIPKE